jgi:hypothetical protein
MNAMALEPVGNTAPHYDPPAQDSNSDPSASPQVHEDAHPDSPSVSGAGTPGLKLVPVLNPQAQALAQGSQPPSTPPSNTAPSDQPTLAPAELTRRAHDLHDRLHDHGFLGLGGPTRYSDIAPDLQGLSQPDAQALTSVYNSTYGARGERNTLLSDINRELPSVNERYQAYQSLAPDAIHPQLALGPSDRRDWSVTAERPLDVQVPGAKVAYRLDSPDLLYASDNPPQVRAFVVTTDGTAGSTQPRPVFGGRAGAFDAAAASRDPNVVELHAHNGSFEYQVPETGHYQVVFEVKYNNGPAEYHTYNQIVRPADAVARQTLDAVQTTTPAPELLGRSYNIQIPQTQQALALEKAAALPDSKRINQLQTTLDTLNKAQDETNKALSGGTGAALPIQAVLVASETGQPIPLQVYAKPLGNNRWAVVDTTDPTRPVSYEATGNSNEAAIENAWHRFIDKTQLPAGEVVAHAPQIPPGYQGSGTPGQLNFGGDQNWHDHNDGKTSFSDWVSGLSWGSVALGGLGIVAAIVPGAEPAAPFLFAAAGATGAAAGGLDIYDRVDAGTFQLWSTQTAIDVLSIVGGAAGASGSALRASAVTRLLSGSGEAAQASLASGEIVNLQRLGNYVQISSKVAIGSGAASGLLIGKEYLQQIQDIANSNLPPSEKERKTNEILQQAVLAGGIMVIGHGLGKLGTTNADLVSAQMRGAGLSPELQQAVRQSPALQTLYVERGPLLVNRLAGEYQRIRNPAETFSEFAARRAAMTAPVFRNVEFVDARGSPLGEFDQIANGVLVEDKSARGLGTINPKTGKPQETADQWAQGQIFEKTDARISNLQKAVSTRTKDSNGAPSLDEIKAMRHLEFRIESTAPEIQRAVQTQIDRLKAKYPDWTFTAKFGG